MEKEGVLTTLLVKPFIRTEESVLFLLHRLTHRRAVRILANLLTFFGSATFVLLLSAVLLFRTFRSPLATGFILAHIIGTAIVQFIKAGTSRCRPYQRFANIIYNGPRQKDYSFPSGHTNSAFTSAVVLSTFFPEWSFFFLSLAALVGLSRIILGAHYPSDVLIGGIIGTLLTSTILQFVI